MNPTNTVSQLDSAAIEEFHYNEAKQELTLTLKSGSYAYQGVPRNVVGEMLSADSVGAYFVANIRNTYDHVKLD